ncbi:MAG: hypothetical protein Q9187_002274, partial [Circinaria calcarea]
MRPFGPPVDADGVRMALDVKEKDNDDGAEEDGQEAMGNGLHDKASDEDEEEEEEAEEEEEPRLKYASLTKSQAPVYRNADATSAFMVAGDKMVIGTHNGNIHVLSLPSFQPLRVYHAHSASITMVSISPNPPPLPVARPDALKRIASDRLDSPGRSSINTAPNVSSPKSPKQPPVPVTPSNSIHIATSSIDGNVCVASLLDPKDVLLRNFGRPLQAVALSPEYKNDRTYLSGGLAGNLVMTVGGRAGTSSTSNTTGGAAAAASGWLGTIGGTIGLGSQNGNDTVLHSGEGSISTIKWSLTGKFVVWVNEQGIKIMRSNLHLEAAETDASWKRISHIDRPNRPGWDEMAGVWKARAEWINEDGLESEEAPLNVSNGTQTNGADAESNAVNGLPQRNDRSVRRAERLVIGWAGTIWIIDVYPGGPGVGREVGEPKVGRAEVVTILRTDCIISGISLYTPNLLLVLAYVTPEEDDNHTLSNAQSTPKRGFHRRRNGLQPEMRIIDITTKEEVCVADTLNVSRFESLSATDYHLGVLPVIRTASKIVNQRGTLETIGGTIWDATMYPTRVLGDSTRIIGSGLWDATMYPTRFFTSAPNAPSSRSNSSISERQSSSRTPSGIIADNNLTAVKSGQIPHPATLTRGMKIFIQSPYDCVLATRPTISDHLAWLDSHEKYEEAWNLLDAHPEAVTGLPERTPGSSPGTPTRAVNDLKAAPISLEDFFADDGSQTTTSLSQNFNSQVEKEKRRIGDRWVQQLVNQKEWSKAGEVCGRVLGTSASWERWIWVFAHENKYAEITPYIPTTQLQPPLPSLVYEDVLGHYILQDRTRLKELLERWPPELFDVNSVIHAIQGKLNAGDVREDTVEGQEMGRDWRTLMECLAKLYLADARAREALKCYIKLHDADSAMALISTYHLIDALSDDIPGLILLRISKEQQKSAPLSELEELTAEPIRLLVDEAHHGIVRPETVISQLKSRPGMLPYLFFYLRALWNGDTSSSNVEEPLSSTHLAATEGKSLVSDFADLAVELFAEYDRPLLLDFLKTSQSYTLSIASAICEKRQYIPELVYLLSKEGRTKKALFIIIENLQDVSQAITFAKDQDDPDLWNDLLDYSMNKPSFIRGLLEEVGTAIDPIKLVRRIPEGLEIEGLRE